MSQRPIYLALYKGNRDGSGWRVWIARATDWLTRVLTRGKYSHAEIAIRLPETAEYECYSASIRDKGVRMKTMPLSADKWDLIPLDDAVLHAHTVGLYLRTAGQGYDLMGALGIAFGLPQNRKRWFCSEWCAAALGLPESWRWSPNDLAAIVPALKRQA